MKNPYSFWRLLWRSLLPSSASIIAGSLIVFCIVGLQLLSLSLNYGSLLPQLFGDFGSQWTEIYNRFVVEPVQSFTTNSTVNTFILALFWGLIGWLLFSSVNFVVNTLRDIRENQESVTVLNEANIIRHPLRRTLIARMAWRLSIFIVAVVTTIFLLRLAHNLSVMVEEGFYAPSLSQTFAVLGLAYLGWMLILHAYVVLLRLYLFRTRIFGEIIK